MAKYSKDLCADIREIVVNKKKSHFERCDDIFRLLKGGFFGKELIERYADEYHIIKQTLSERKIANSQWLAVRCIDRFVRQGRVHTMTDNRLKITLGILSDGMAETIRKKIKDKKKDMCEQFINKVCQQFQQSGNDVFDYSQGIYHDEDTVMLMICQRCETQFLQTPKRHITSKFPCFQCVLYSKGYVANDEKTDHWARVIPGLFVGNIHSAQDQGFLISKRIRGVIDLTGASQLKLIRGIKVCKINLEDNVNANIKPYLNQTFNFMNELLGKNQGVLVFCRAGMSRSASIVIHYLMKCHNISYYDAFRFVKSKRSQIQPNAGFVRQLQEVEETMLDSILM